MIQKKICMLGATGVGKTSLVSRFVSSIFSDKYLTTVGVKIDKKTVTVEARTVTLVLWDIYGEDAFQSVRASYLRGAAGYLLVADGTRQLTLDTARSLQKTAARRRWPRAVRARAQQGRPHRRVAGRRQGALEDRRRGLADRAARVP